MVDLSSVICAETYVEKLGVWPVVVFSNMKVRTLFFYSLVAAVWINRIRFVYNSYVFRPVCVKVIFSFRAETVQIA
jgi:hypothetical protein